MCSHHECFANFHAGTVAHIEERPCLRNVQPDGLFAEHVFASFRGFDGPGHMQMIRQRIVDGLDLRVRSRSSYDQYALGMRSLRATSSAFLPSREAIATMSLHSPACMPGITLRTPMPA